MLRLSVGEDDKLEEDPGLLGSGLLTGDARDGEEFGGALEIVVELVLLLGEDDELEEDIGLLDPEPLIGTEEDVVAIRGTLEVVDELTLLVGEDELEEGLGLLDPGLISWGVEDDKESCRTLEIVDELRLLVREVDELEEGPRSLLLEDKVEEIVSAALARDAAEIYLLLDVVADDVVEDGPTD